MFKNPPKTKTHCFIRQNLLKKASRAHTHNTFQLQLDTMDIISIQFLVTIQQEHYSLPYCLRDSCIWRVQRLKIRNHTQVLEIHRGCSPMTHNKN